MKEMAVPIAIGERVRLSNGFTVSAQKLREKRSIPPSSTAKHEAIHAVLAERNGTYVKSATIVPGPGYLGMTELSDFNAVAAVGPHAHGCDGTGFDMFIVEQSGLDVGVAQSVAKSTLATSGDEIDEVAMLLQERGTVTGGEIREAMRETHMPEGVVVEINSPFGNTRVIEQDSPPNNIIMLPGEVFDLQAA